MRLLLLLILTPLSLARCTHTNVGWLLFLFDPLRRQRRQRPSQRCWCGACNGPSRPLECAALPFPFCQTLLPNLYSSLSVDCYFFRVLRRAPFPPLHCLRPLFTRCSSTQLNRTEPRHISCLDSVLRLMVPGGHRPAILDSKKANKSAVWQWSNWPPYHKPRPPQIAYRCSSTRPNQTNITNPPKDNTKLNGLFDYIVKLLCSQVVYL